MTAHAAASPRRGRPLVALALLLVGWTAVRLALWESPFARAVKASAEGVAGTAPQVADEAPSAVAFANSHQRYEPTRWITRPAVVQVQRSRAHASLALPPGAQQTLSALYQMALPQGPRVPAPGIIVQPLPAPSSLNNGRFHLAAWAAWREGSGLPGLAKGGLPPGYGGSQLGLMGQFDLATGPRRPALHLRGTYAPDRPHQAEIAAGVGVRPFAAIPVRVLGEVRATHAEMHTEVRPALFAVTELPPVSLPFGVRVEGYAQGGWVGGRYATAFADGQARVTHAAVVAGRARLRFGAGAWGGAQKFAERLDVGPTVTGDLAPVRLAIDYRVRVAGNARPGNGLALTLSTGF